MRVGVPTEVREETAVRSTPSGSVIVELSIDQGEAVAAATGSPYFPLEYVLLIEHL